MLFVTNMVFSSSIAEPIHPTPLSRKETGKFSSDRDTLIL